MKKKEWRWPLSLLIHHVERGIYVDLNARMGKAEIPFRIEHWPVLKMLIVNNGQTQQELANTIYKDKATLTRTIDSLEKIGLVERKFDAKDRRKRLVFITEKAIGYAGKVRKVFDAHTDFILKDIDEEKLDHTIDVMQSIFKRLMGEEEWKR